MNTDENPTPDDKRSLTESEPAPLFPRPRTPRGRLWAGFFFSQFYGLAQLAIIALAGTRFDWTILGRAGEYTRVIMAVSSILGVPFVMGIVASYFWYDLPNVRRKMWSYGFLNFLLSCLGAAAALREGTICLIMAAPLLWPAITSGIGVGLNFWRRPPFLQISVLPLLTLIFIADATYPRLYRTSTTTVFHSPAPPQRLWRYVAGYPVNNRSADWWLWKMGLPMPVQSTGKPVVGGRRDCRFSGNVKIGERIVEAIPNRRLEFVIDAQPQHPEALNHFILERGRIELLPDGHGGTILRGTSWYRLNVFPAAYFDLWTSAIVRHTHRRVFEHMSELAQN